MALAFAATLLSATSAFATPYTNASSSANVQYNIEDGIATIYGSVDSPIEKTLVEHAILGLDGVESVSNNLFVTN